VTVLAAVSGVRRRRAVLLGTPVLAALFWAAAPAADWWLAPAVLVLGALAAGVLATYVPVDGPLRRVDLGCTPCAAVAAGSVLAAPLVMDAVPGAGGASTAGAVLLFGLAQRLGAPAACPAPAGRR
jgi:hypothetical protein